MKNCSVVNVMFKAEPIEHSSEKKIVDTVLTTKELNDS